MKASGKKGYILFEALFSSVILASCLMGIALMLATGLGYISRIRERSVATQAAQEGVELIRNMPFSDILSVDSDFNASGMQGLSNATGTITVDNPGSTADMRRVTVTIDWTSLQGTAANKELVTFVTRGGINRQ